MIASILAGVCAVGVVALIARRVAPVLAAPPPRTAPDTARRARRRRRIRVADDADVAEWCEHAAGALRSGSSLRRAMVAASEAVPAAAPAFAPAFSAETRGRSAADAIGLLERDPARPVGLVTPVLQACADLGGPAARALDRVAATLHARHAERAERDTATAQARLSARILTLLPVATLALLSVTEESTRDALGTPLGAACVAAGLVGNLAGWWWMRTIIGRAS